MRRLILMMVLIFVIVSLLHTKIGILEEYIPPLQVEEIQEEPEVLEVVEEPEEQEVIHFEVEIVKPTEEEIEEVVEEVVEFVEPIFEYSAFTVSNLTAADFDQMLVGSPLEGLGYAFVQVEEEYGVNGLFALAVCNLESGLGREPANTNNFFGFYLPGGYMSFDTPEDGINYFGKLMSGSIYSGKTIDQIAPIYCPPNSSWANLVRELMDENWDKIA